MFSQVLAFVLCLKPEPNRRGHPEGSEMAATRPGSRASGGQPGTAMERGCCLPPCVQPLGADAKVGLPCYMSSFWSVP